MSDIRVEIFSGSEKEIMKKIIYIIIVGLTCWVACIDRIELDIPLSEERKLVIEGSVSKSGKEVELYALVGTNTDIFDRGPKVNTIETAAIYLVYNGVEVRDIPLENGQRIRLPLERFQSKAPGSTDDVFQLAVELTNGKRYLSAEERIIAVPAPDSLLLDPDTRKQLNANGSLLDVNFVEVKVSSPITNENGEKVFLRWNFEGTYRFLEQEPPSTMPTASPDFCYIPDRIGTNSIVLFNGAETSDDALIRYPILEIPYSIKLASGYYVSVYQQTLTPRAYNFWNKVRLNASSGQSLFDAVPGAVEGNIMNVDDEEEEVLGYFYASDVDTVRGFINPGRFGPPQLPTPPCSTSPGSNRCRNCLTINRSSLVKPYFWIQ